LFDKKIFFGDEEERNARKDRELKKKLVPEACHELTNFRADAPRKRNILIRSTFLSFFSLPFLLAPLAPLQKAENNPGFHLDFDGRMNKEPSESEQNFLHH
jgi:hypothetical protein